MTLQEKIRAIPDDRRILIYADDPDHGWPPDFTIADLKALSAALDEARKGLEHYANKSSWLEYVGDDVPEYEREYTPKRHGYDFAKEKLARIDALTTGGKG